MPRIFDKLDPKKEKDIVVLANFVQIFCRENHGDEAKETFSIKDERLTEILGEKKIELCDDCSRLLSHGIGRSTGKPHHATEN